jgi:hypothetical protein|tara:strand:- start:1736 stop:1909 length:174 start_codon:yes stop_codon:yes gene_type:complete
MNKEHESKTIDELIAKYLHEGNEIQTVDQGATNHRNKLANRKQRKVLSLKKPRPDNE